jgi:hypothetical protein
MLVVVATIMTTAVAVVVDRQQVQLAAIPVMVVRQVVVAQVQVVHRLSSVVVVTA